MPITILYRGDDDDPRPVELDIDVFRELAAWLLAAEEHQPMTLPEAAATLLPLAGAVVDALIKAGHTDDATRLVWAAATLREAVKEDDRPEVPLAPG